MNTSHIHYEILAALAAAGQLSTDELDAFNHHAAFCQSCNETLPELSSLNRELFLLTASHTRARSIPHGMTERFTRQALRAGIPIPQPARNSHKLLQFATVTILLAVSLTLSRQPLRAPVVLPAETPKFAFATPLESISSSFPKLLKRPVRPRIAQTPRRPVFTLDTPPFPQADYATLGPHTLLPQSSELAAKYVTSGLDLPNEVTLSKPPLPSFRAITQLLATGQHPSPKLASLSFTDAPIVFHFNQK